MRLPIRVGPTAAACAFLLTASTAIAQTAGNVAVVINDSSPASVTIGEYYVAKRGIPAENVIRLTLPPGERISRTAYAAGLETPIAQVLTKGRLQDRILYIVLTKGVPLRIEGTSGPYGTAASVDSELTLLYRRMTGRPVPPGGPLDNPYFARGESDPAAGSFSHKDYDLFLVTRLDGFSVEDVKRLIDRGLTGSAVGPIVFDQRGDTRSAVADRWMTDAADAVASRAPEQSVVLESTPKLAASTDLLAYFSWGATDPAIAAADPSLSFAPGGIAATLGSNDGRSFEVPAKGRRPLGGALVQAGASGVGVNVAEPYLQSSFRPQVLFPAYVAGLPLAEAFYRALPHVSWQAVVIGDPLLRPFGKPAALAEIDPPVNQVTGMPEYFSARRLAALRTDLPQTPPAALEQMLAAEVHVARQESDHAVAALTRAAELAPDTAAVHLRLAGLHEEAGDKAKAADRYRRVIDLQPRHVVALNNLAFALSAQPETRDEAFQLASRAYTLSPTDGTIIDTLGWIEHLRGNGPEAARLLRLAAQRSPAHAEIRLHAAIVLAASGTVAEAKPHLDAALKLDPTLAERADVKDLKQRLER